jgi:hypothetical protein
MTRWDKGERKYKETTIPSFWPKQNKEETNESTLN